MNATNEFWLIHLENCFLVNCFSYWTLLKFAFSGPREDATRIGSAGAVRRQAVDISPLRRVNQAIYLLTTGARESAFRNIKTIAECLADELINAAKGSSNRYYASYACWWSFFLGRLIIINAAKLFSYITVWMCVCYEYHASAHNYNNCRKLYVSLLGLYST
jgi:hypothetical protein